LEQKKSKTTVLGIIAAAMFLTSHPDSPVKEIMPEKVKAYTVLGGTLALGLLGKFAADSKPAPPDKPKE